MATVATEFGSLAVLIPSWERSLRAANKSPKTIRSYGDSARLFVDFAAERLGITDVTHVSREHVETFINDQLERFRPGTAAVRYRSLQQLFKWLVEEGEVKASPMANMKPPAIPEVPVPIVSDEDLRKLLKVCEGREFAERRDTALIRLFLDTGCRLGEVAALKVDDVDFDAEAIGVLGKGRRPRQVAFSAKTGVALDRYLRLRRTHAHSSSTSLWIGKKGAMTGNGIARMIGQRCSQAGIDPLHPHQFRHTSAHVWLAAGGSETGAMRRFGWRSRQMLSRYGASAADERARDEARRLALGDRL